MSPFQALSAAGRQVLRQRILLALFYVCNLVLSALLIVPVSAAMMTFLGHSLESSRELANFDPAWLLESLRKADFIPLNIAPAFFLALASIYLLTSTFLAGGAISVYLRPADTFFGSCARYFIRFVRLALLSAPVYGIVIALNMGAASAISRFAEDSMEAHQWVILGWARAVVVLLLLLFVNMIFDYSKIVLVSGERRSAFMSAIHGIRFVRGHFGACSAIFHAGQFLGLLFLLAYHGLTELTGQNSAVMVALVFFLRQAYILARYWTRLFVWSAGIKYYQALGLRPVEPSGTMFEIPLEPESLEQLLCRLNPDDPTLWPTLP
jgi:hypothetical protein